MSIDKCSYYPSTKKILFTVDREHPRKPQLNTMQRSMDHGDLSPNRHNSITVPACMAQGTPWMRGIKILYELEYQEIY